MLRVVTRRQSFVDDGVEPMLRAGRRSVRADGWTFARVRLLSSCRHIRSIAIRKEIRA